VHKVLEHVVNFLVKFLIYTYYKDSVIILDNNVFVCCSPNSSVGTILNVPISYRDY
jgi:hypothetical protein